ncbi:hypothetical protein BDN70DRAFT_926685 [Pholiota conissans]|uniref:Uncharacterized protein n=1 Tax=Pholiota conissans TaxID=109636 RepID=A0A9P5ZDU9_9AGAR|nr:hypothetical protein BDN70DRAFT_926685 [Pholiota conissans]
MYPLIAARTKTILLWTSIEALFGGFVWQAYRTRNRNPALIQAQLAVQRS